MSNGHQPQEFSSLFEFDKTTSGCDPFSWYHRIPEARVGHLTQVDQAGVEESWDERGTEKQPPK